jgi:hypothetical protein
MQMISKLETSHPSVVKMSARYITPYMHYLPDGVWSRGTATKPRRRWRGFLPRHINYSRTRAGLRLPRSGALELTCSNVCCFPHSRQTHCQNPLSGSSKLAQPHCILVRVSVSVPTPQSHLAELLRPATHRSSTP